MTNRETKDIAKHRTEIALGQLSLCSTNSGWGVFMDIIRAKEIIHTLADGIDPTTGEILSPDHVCNRADVIRALHIAEQVLQKDLNQPEDGPWHKEYGKVWSQQEADFLIKCFDKHYTVAQISKQLGRSEAGIRAKLVRLGKIQNRKDAK